MLQLIKIEFKIRCYKRRIGAHHRLRSIYKSQILAILYNTSVTAYRISKCVSIYACLRSAVTYVGHQCPTVWHAQSCSGGVLLSGCI